MSSLTVDVQYYWGTGQSVGRVREWVNDGLWRRVLLVGRLLRRLAFGDLAEDVDLDAGKPVAGRSGLVVRRGLYVELPPLDRFARLLARNHDH